MERINYPDRSSWEALCQRPVFDPTTFAERVQNIMQQVKTEGDKALLELTARFDGAELTDLKVSEAEIAEAVDLVSDELKEAIQLAKSNIERFHAAQLTGPQVIETTPGVKCWRKSVPVQRVGLYIPGGSAPLFSTLLMLGVPALLAKCPTIVLCTPPNKDGKIAPEVLYTASLLGLSNIYKVGGAQAIAAMTYGTDSVPAVDKLFGPGNQYVTMAKMLAQQQGVAIDMPAGPSEVLIVADETCVPAYVAADLLSQAEHGPDSQVMLLSDSAQVLDCVALELDKQLNQLPRKETAAKALQNSRAILLNDLTEAMWLSNLYAPEHLILATDKAEDLAEQVTQAGSVFLGNYSCESAGDYASGTNHTLPTNGYARNYSGVSMDSFVKKITFQNLSAEGVRSIGKAVTLMAEAEQLDAHKNAMLLRMKDLNND